MHHERVRRNGEPGPAKPYFKGRSLNRTCNMPKCEHRHYALGLCHQHYNQNRWIDKTSDNKCSMTGCDFKHLAKGFCYLHYVMVKAPGKFYQTTLYKEIT